MRTTLFTAASEDAGERLDRVVAAHCPELYAEELRAFFRPYRVKATG